MQHWQNTHAQGLRNIRGPANKGVQDKKTVGQTGDDLDRWEVEKDSFQVGEMLWGAAYIYNERG